MTLTKPVMRRLLASQIKRDVFIGFTLAIVAAVSWKYFVLEDRKKKYAEFYKNYDAMADFERMKHTGYFQSVQEE